MRAFAVAYLLATWFLQQQSELPPSGWATAAAAPLLGCLLLPTRLRVARVLLLALAGGSLGFGLGAWRAEHRLAEALPHALEGVDVEVTGIVADLPQPARDSVRFLLDVESARGRVPSRVSLAWYAQRTRAGAAPALPRVVPGERWRFTVRLKRPRGLANPHAFDFEPWALERGIRATGYVRAQPQPVRLAGEVSGWPQSVHLARWEVRERMRHTLGGAPYAGVLVALAIGDQAAIEPAQWEVFWRTGVGHLVSISGLHITMLAALAFSLAFFVAARVPALALRCPARKVAAVAGLAAALAYTLLAGFAVPAQRTLVMLLVVAAAVVADRPVSPSRVLAFAALVVVAIDPWAVLSPGFWLSFGAIAAIFLALGGRTGRPTALQAGAREQLAVTIAMLPLLATLFQQVSLASPLANAFAIPLISLAVVPLTLAGALLGLGPALEAAHALMAAAMAALHWVAAWPQAVLETHAPAAWTVAAALLGAAWLLAPRGVPLRSCGALWMVPLFAATPPGPAPGSAWVDVLDVGNGLAVVVRTARHALVYDAGPSWSADSDGGSRVVLPFLRGEGVSRLDMLVISHADDDHYGGAFSLAAATLPRELLSPLPPGDPLHLMAASSSRCEAGAAWTWDGVRFTVLHPAPGAYGEPRRRENDRSCVLRVAARDASMLLTGDVEARSELEMVTRGAWLESDVLLAPHHGSKTSSSAAFLDSVAPRRALFSVGHRNRHRHPHAAVLGRYSARGVIVYRTDRDGALHLRLPGGGAAMAAPRPFAARARYWSDRRGAP